MEKSYSLAVGRLVIAEGDITLEETDAIVNAANEGLLGGGGVDGAIHRAAGPELLAACREVKSRLPGGRLAPGLAVATPGFGLRARHIIHCVGPVYDRDPADAPRVLASCYSRAAALCRELEVTSVAFPAISTGIYRYPVPLAAEVAVRALRDDARTHLESSIQLIRFMLFDRRAFEAFEAASDKLLTAG